VAIFISANLPPVFIHNTDNNVRRALEAACHAYLRNKLSVGYFPFPGGPLDHRGQQGFFRIYAELGGSYTQYNMTWDEANKSMTLSGQWLNTDDKSLRTADMLQCTGSAQLMREPPKALSTLELFQQGKAGTTTFLHRPR